MYLTDQPGSSIHSRARYERRAPSVTPTSIPLDDGFDAATTEVPTEWTVGEGHRDYEESVTGYQNFVREMERKLSREHEYFETAYPSPVPPHAGPSTHYNMNFDASMNQKVNGKANARTQTKPRERAVDRDNASGMNGRGHGARRRESLGRATSPENVRRVSGRKGLVELVEHRVMEDTPQRTISLWRERVAQSDTETPPGCDDQRSVANSHAHRRMSSYESREGRAISGEKNGQVSAKSNARKDAAISRPRKISYERSEYMVAYRQLGRTAIHPQSSYAPSEVGHVRAYNTNVPFSPPRQKTALPTPQSPTMRRTSGRSSFERTEYMITYPNTPPKSTSSPGSSPNAAHQKVAGPPHDPPMSPLNGRHNFPMRTDVSNSTRSTSTSSVELILSSCEPSLLHIAPALTELGIYRTEHLRAVARLSEETRNREVKDQALKKGVTVMEWAILFDKLLTL